MVNIFRSKYVVFNEDEDSSKPYIPLSIDPKKAEAERRAMMIEEVVEPTPYNRTVRDDLIDDLRPVENSDFFNYGKPYYKKTILNNDKATLKYCE